MKQLFTMMIAITSLSAFAQDIMLHKNLYPVQYTKHSPSGYQNGIKTIEFNGVTCTECNRDGTVCHDI
jgi:hypothetical protein